jgi:hypothetical protein
MGKVTDRPLPWLDFDVDSGWVPLYQAPFVYRIRSAENLCEPWDSVALGRELASRLQHLGVHDAIIDPPSGKVTLTLSQGTNDASSVLIHFLLTSFDPDEVSDECLREAIWNGMHSW